MVGTGDVSAAGDKAPVVNGAVPPGFLLNKRSHMDWILAALSGVPVKDGFRAENSTRISVAAVSGIRVNAALPAGRPGAAPSGGPRLEAGAADGFVYQNARLSSIPSKMSVTEIKRVYYAEEAAGSAALSAAAPKLARPGFLTRRAEPDAGARGILLHTAMERLDFRMPPSIPLIEEYVKSLENSGFIAEGASRFIPAEWIRRFLAGSLAERIRRSKKVFRESRFVFGASPESLSPAWAGVKSPEILVHGVIDCYFEENGGFVVVDYKTDTARGGVSAAAEKYRLQTLLYKEAIERSTGIAVNERVIYFFSAGEAVSL
jgi:ATP-dependent helicase/nuclease subunit A